MCMQGSGVLENSGEDKLLAVANFLLPQLLDLLGDGFGGLLQP